MNHLVDTHYLIWSLLEPGKINERKKKILLDPGIVKNVSKISYWEIALKYSLGKLEIRGIVPDDLPAASLAAGYELVDVSVEDLVTSYRLPRVKDHQDPFDRLLIWQCIRNNLVLMTDDDGMRRYEKYGLKLA